MKKPGLRIPLLTNRSLFSARIRASVGELNAVYERIFSSPFLFPSTLVRDARQRAWQRPELLHQLTRRTGLNREQSEALFQHRGAESRSGKKTQV